MAIINYYFQILDETIPFVMNKSQVQKRRNLPYLTKVQCDISVLPFVQTKDYQIKCKSS